MTRDIEIVPTNTCPPDLDELTRRSAVVSAYASVVQLDVGDGVFVPVKSWPYGEGQWGELEIMGATKQGLPHIDTLLYEVHLMVQHPLSAGVAFARAGAKRIIGHIEAFGSAEKARDAFKMWKLSGAKEVGVAVLVDTSCDALAPYAGLCDVIMVMTIGKLGAQGAPFEPRAVERVAALRKRYPDMVIEVDGGISSGNIVPLTKAGATRFAVGSTLWKSANPTKTYATLKAAAEKAV